MSVVLSLPPRTKRARDWTNNELAELYRVKHALSQANFELEVDRGITDEGDPWFVFCRYDGEVLVHIARYEGLYRLFSSALPIPLVGSTFSELTRRFVSEIPEKNEASVSSNVIRHPSALLSLLIVTIFFSVDYLTGHGGRAEAAPLSPASGRDGALQLTISNMLASIGNAEENSLSESAYLAVQAAALLIGDSATLCDFASSGTVATASEAVGSLTDSVSCLTVAPAPPLDPSPADPAGVQSGLVIQANNDITAATVQTALGAITEPVTAVTLASTATIMTAPALLPVETHAQTAVHSAEQIVVLASATGSEVNLASNRSVHLIELTGNGSVTLSGLSGNGSQAIEVLGSSAETLRLKFSAGATSFEQTLTIKDGSSVTLQSVSVQGETTASTGNPAVDGTRSDSNTPDTATLPTVDLTVDSAGSQPNTLTVSNAAVQGVTLDLKIIGSQNLTLQESAQVLNGSSLDASRFQGQLTVGVDLSGSPDPTTLLGSSKFIVHDNGIVALVNVPDNATIQVATNLESLLTQFASASSNHTLGLTLQSVEQSSNPVSVGVVKVGTTTLELNSTAAVGNNVGALFDPDLQNLEINGAGSLSIGSIVGVTSVNDQNITIDASHLSGGLSIDVSGIPDVASGGRQITIIGGQGNNVLTNSNPKEAMTFVAGGGQDTFNVAAGAQSVNVKGLHAGDTVVVGGGSTSDTVVDATHLATLSSAHLNSLTLQAAASAAAAAVAAAPHQAVLFDYNNSNYVFIDAGGGHAFDAADALIQIVGMSKAVDLSHVFFSA